MSDHGTSRPRNEDVNIQVYAKDDVRPRKRQRKSRSKGQRARTGCIACRTKHVKCPEERPQCSTCQKAQRDCVYPLDINTEAVTSTSARQLARDVNDFAENDAGDGVHEQDGAPRHALAKQSLDASNYPDRSDLEYIPPAESSVWSSVGQVPPDDGLGTSPDSTWSGGPGYSAEAASLRWFGLLATDASQGEPNFSPGGAAIPNFQDSSPHLVTVDREQQSRLAIQQITSQANDTFISGRYISADAVTLIEHEIGLFQHFVQHLSSWIDITDPERSFSVTVPSMALRNSGLMTAILALSSRHLSLVPQYLETLPQSQYNGLCNSAADRTMAVQYYNETLRYLQQAMKNVLYLRSDELLATVLTISTYEMIDGSGRGWERHLKGVFWIQRSQLIHGESEGLKKWIWWAWLRQDIWAAFRERRKILSFYTLARPCSTLNFWELVNRAVFLLGQCVNYTSDTEVEGGRLDLRARMEKADSLWASLEEWRRCFEPFDRRLPVSSDLQSAFRPIWINQPAASLAIQVHHFAKLLLLEYMLAFGVLKMDRRAPVLQESVNTICGIAYRTTEAAPMIVSTQCLYAAGLHVSDSKKQDQVVEMLQAHQSKTGWPHYEIWNELRSHWKS